MTVTSSGAHAERPATRICGAWTLTAAIQNRSLTAWVSTFPITHLMENGFLYTAYDPVSSVWSIWKVSSDGGVPVRLTEKESALSSVSPDGQFFACNYQDQVEDSYKIAIIPLAGGQPSRMFDTPGSFGRMIQWTADGRALTYVDTQGGVSNLWMQSLTGGAPRQLTDFKDQRIYGFAWSRDGKQLAI